jgi:hypothetical protein
VQLWAAVVPCGVVGARGGNLSDRGQRAQAGSGSTYSRTTCAVFPFYKELQRGIQAGFWLPHRNEMEQAIVVIMVELRKTPRLTLGRFSVMVFLR